MNNKILKILLYVFIVLASIFIVYRRYLLLDNPNQNIYLSYAILIFFIIFAYINLRVLVKLIKEYRK